MGLFSKIFDSVTGNSHQSNDLSTSDFLSNLDQNQKDNIVYQVNSVIKVITSYQQERGVSIVLGESACLFMMKDQEVGGCGIVGNNSMIRKIPQEKFDSLIYFRNLKSYPLLVANPSDIEAIRSVASEATLYLLSGRKDFF
jgi:hypothetical protein